jgi:hypothetical protein
MARAGRKRKLNAKRRTATTRAARMPENIGPTPEVLARKARLLGYSLGDIVDIRTRQTILLQDASTPLAVLFARGVIDREQKEVGEEYARLYWRHLGTPWPTVSAMSERVSNGSVRAIREDDPEREERMAARFKRLYEALDRQGVKIREATNSVCVNGYWPAGAGDCAEFVLSKWGLPEVLAGLQALVESKRGR